MKLDSVARMIINNTKDEYELSKKVFHPDGTITLNGKTMERIIDHRLQKHKEAIKEIPKIPDKKKRHSAYKQIHGRILELQYLQKIMLK